MTGKARAPYPERKDTLEGQKPVRIPRRTKIEPPHMTGKRNSMKVFLTTFFYTHRLMPRPTVFREALPRN